jgi:hypothetical protein
MDLRHNEIRSLALGQSTRGTSANRPSFPRKNRLAELRFGSYALCARESSVTTPRNPPTVDAKTSRQGEAASDAEMTCLRNLCGCPKDKRTLTGQGELRGCGTSTNLGVNVNTTVRSHNPSVRLPSNVAGRRVVHCWRITARKP